MRDKNWLYALNLHPDGLEEIGVSEILRPERLKFEMSERPERSEEVLSECVPTAVGT
jgi:hypothetical protein